MRTALLELSYLEPLLGPSNPFAEMLKTIGTSNIFFPALGDLNGDGLLEAIIGTSKVGLLYGVNTGMFFCVVVIVFRISCCASF